MIWFLVFAVLVLVGFAMEQAWKAGWRFLTRPRTMLSKKKPRPWVDVPTPRRTWPPDPGDEDEAA